MPGGRGNIAHIESNTFSVAGHDDIKFVFSLTPADMKWLATYAGETNNAFYYFSTFADVHESNKATLNGSLGDDSICTFHPWKYEDRVKNAQKISDFKTKLKAILAPSTKRKKIVDEIKRLHTRNEFEPILKKLIDKAYAEPLLNVNNAWQQWNTAFWEFVVQLTPEITAEYKAVDDLPDGTPFKSYTVCLKKKVKACRVYKKIKTWYAQGGKEDKYGKYRFTGKESKLFSRSFMHLTSSIYDIHPNLTHLQRMKLFVFHYLGMLLRDISSLMARIHVGPNYLDELKVKCKKYFNSYSLFLNSVTPTIWNIGHAVPFHAKKVFDEFGLGLGVNTMQGREAKHIQILRCVKARVQNLMKNGIQNLICMHFDLLFCKNHHEILKVNVNHHC